MKNSIKIIALGDVVGRNACEYAANNLSALKKEYAADIIIVNGENSSDNNGLDKKSLDMLLYRGADVITSGNHAFKHKETDGYLDDCDYLLRPANYGGEYPGTGYLTLKIDNVCVLVVNLLGKVYMSDDVASPFLTLENILQNMRNKYDIALVDFHAEATSEKIALAKAFDGRVSAVFGTHTHVATADERILQGGTGFITDIGMCGPEDSILGVKSEIIINRFYEKDMNAKFVYADGKISGNGVFFEINLQNGKCIDVKRVRF